MQRVRRAPYGATFSGISTTFIREPSSAELSKTTSVATSSTSAGREVERASRARPRRRGDEVLVDDVPLGVEELVLEVRLERVRRARDAEAGS